jgi:hypothetical protein
MDNLNPPRGVAIDWESLIHDWRPAEERQGSLP